MINTLYDPTKPWQIRKKTLGQVVFLMFAHNALLMLVVGYFIPAVSAQVVPWLLLCVVAYCGVVWLVAKSWRTPKTLKPVVMMGFYFAVLASQVQLVVGMILRAHMGQGTLACALVIAFGWLLLRMFTARVQLEPGQ